MKYSTGWFARFMKRHSLSRRRVISTVSRPVRDERGASDVVDVTTRFRNRINSLDSRTILINMDETLTGIL